MKATNVSTSAPAVDVAKTPAAPAEDGGTDFLALFTEAMATGETSELAATFAKPNLPLDAQPEDDDGGFDEADLAALMAALAGANTTSAQASPAANEVSPDLLAARAPRTNELTAAVVMNALVSPADEADAKTDTAEGAFDTALKGMDSGTSTATLDPRLGQSALDQIRDTRGNALDAPVHRQLHSTVGTRAWSEELGNQITWLTDRGLQSASLRLSPEHLGPLEIQISIQDDKASVWFGAAHADTRAAIEGALPRLREMLASQGLALNDAGVFKESPRQQGQYKAERGLAADTASGVEEVQSISRARLGLVDAYA